MASHREASDGSEAVQKAEELEAGLNSAGHRSPKVEWNRSRPADTTTLPQLQDYLPKPEQFSRRGAGSFEHGRSGLRS